MTGATTPKRPNNLISKPGIAGLFLHLLTYILHIFNNLTSLQNQETQEFPQSFDNKARHMGRICFDKNAAS